MISWRIIRQIWVSVTNGLVLYLALPQLVREVRIGHSFDLNSLENTATVVLMSIGIVLEAMRNRVAKYINVGYYFLMASWILFLALAANRGMFGVDPETGMASLLYGPAFLLVALVNLYLYRAKLPVIKHRE